MSNKKQQIPPSRYNQPRSMPALPETRSLLDVMEDGSEYQSLLKYKPVDINQSEIQRAIEELSAVSGKYSVIYCSNFINSRIKEDISINNGDELPFIEMINKVPTEIREIDIVLVTPGGSAEQVARFVDKLRPRFDVVRFILPYAAMSAGTIFAMSGDDIVMTSGAYLGPIDPQIPGKDGMFLPAQSLNVLISDIQQRGQAKIAAGQSPDWTDILIMNNINPREIGNTKMMSDFAIDLVKNYLQTYKFKSWVTHSSTGAAVTPPERAQRALEVAKNLFEHSFWKIHSRGITREVAWAECKIKIIHPETIPHLDRVIKRLWAVIYFFFENSSIFKIFMSRHYQFLRNDTDLLAKLIKP
jgi:hypothetical protein